MNARNQVKVPALEPDDSQGTVSIVYLDDAPEVVRVAKKYLESLPFCSLRLFTDPELCLAELREDPADIVVTDLSMPQMSGLDILEAVKKMHPDTAVIIATGASDKVDAIQAVKLGAFDFFEKPVRRDELLESIKRTVRYQSLLRERDRLSRQLLSMSAREAARWGLKAFIGSSKAIWKVIADIRILQEAPRTSVLIMGESGTGKELVARAIHTGGKRSAKPFVPINCSAIPDDLAESILFGHVRGAFTGATTDKKGAFELADGGTLFLDEIGDMPSSIQTKLLRVLEDGVVEPVGSSSGKAVDVRIVAATNADIAAKLKDRSFRSDLYHRIAAFTISLPALRDRREDIPLLAEHFAEQLSFEMGMKGGEISADAMLMLKSYDFPGNVRELRNLIEQALIRSEGGEIGPAHLSIDTHVSVAPSSGDGVGSAYSTATLNLTEVEQQVVREALERAEGNVSAAARLLGISRNRLYRIFPECKLQKPSSSVPQ